MKTDLANSTRRPAAGTATPLLYQLVESAKQLQGSFILARNAGREDVASLIRLTMLRLNEAIHSAMQEVELPTTNERGVA